MTTRLRQPNETFAGYADLTVKPCPTCGVLYAAPEALFDSKWRNGGDWYCPNGHCIHFTETAQQKIDKLKNDRARLRAQLDQERERTRGQKAAATRARNERDRERRRTANGVCPCCNRSFKNLRRHMDSQHPDFPPATDA